MVPNFGSVEPDAIADLAPLPGPVGAYVEQLRRHGGGGIPRPEWLKVDKALRKRGRGIPAYIPVTSVHPESELRPPGGDSPHLEVAKVADESTLLILLSGDDNEGVYWLSANDADDDGGPDLVCRGFRKFFNDFDYPPEVLPWLLHIHNDRLDDLVAWAEAGGNVNTSNKYTAPPIVEAMLCDRQDMVTGLVRLGAKIDAQVRQVAEQCGCQL